MTPIESKVRELSDKLCDAITEMQKRKTDNAVIVQSIKSYLAGLTDGIDLAEEVRGDELAVTNDLLAEMAKADDNLNEEIQKTVDAIKEEDSDTDKCPTMTLEEAESLVRASRGVGTTASLDVLNEAFDLLKKSGIDPAKL